MIDHPFDPDTCIGVVDSLQACLLVENFRDDCEKVVIMIFPPSDELPEVENVTEIELIPVKCSDELFELMLLPLVRRRLMEEWERTHPDAASEYESAVFYDDHCEEVELPKPNKPAGLAA